MVTWQSSSEIVLNALFALSIIVLKNCCANCKGNHVAVSIECPIKKEKNYENKKKLRSFTFADILTSLAWCPGQNKRIAPLSFLHGCRKRRLKD
jgi:hypothetical protein